MEIDIMSNQDKLKSHYNDIMENSSNKHKKYIPITFSRKNIFLPDDTEEGEMASALLGGVGVLVFTPAEVEVG